MKNPLFTFLFLLLLTYSKAQTIEWHGDADYLDIASQLDLLEDPKGDFTIDSVSSKDFAKRFVRSHQSILHFGFTESIYWLKFSFENKSATPLYLEVAHAFLPVTDLYFRDSTGAWTKMVAGFQIPMTDKIVKHHLQIFPLPTGAHEFYVRVLSNAHPLPVKIWKKPAYEIKSYRQRLVFGFYLGCMFFVILNNLFLFFSLRNRLYLFYAFTVFIYVSYASAVMDGFVLYFFPKTDMMFWYINIPTIGVPIQMIYCLVFLEARKYVPKLNKFTWGLIIYFSAYVFIKFLFPLTAIMALNTVDALISFFMMGLVGIKVGNKGNKLGYYYSAAYFIYFLLVLTEATYVQTGKPSYPLELSHVAMATLIEAFALSYLLSKRFEWEKADIEKARMEAQNKVIETTQENERIVREQNVLLEQQVAKRTEQLQNTNKELFFSLQTVEQERRKSEELLLNILPSVTAQELKEFGIATPKTYDLVSVLFADIKDFTKSSEKLSPEQLINDLNQCFVQFDKIVQLHRLEKIKTIGDAYMAAGGLPTPNKTHAIDAIKAAQAMLKFIEEWKLRQMELGKTAWDLRIGIHTGSVVAGVVGLHKFSYDIWGDTVNTAARMESYGTPGKVNISSHTFELVKQHFTCASRGEVEVKGKGKLEMFWVENPA